jgi:hypothetical protein
MFDYGSYIITASLFPKLLGLIYFIAFGGFIFQIKGLLGKNGILPINSYLKYYEKIWGKKRFYIIPSIFWLCSKDLFLLFCMYLGAFLGFFLFANPYVFLTPFLLIILFILQLSLVSCGQDFLGFGWELYLLEVTFPTFFLSLSSPPNPFIFYYLYLILFNVHLQAGASKLLSKDPNWRNLTATFYHLQSQPIPNTLAWYAHKLPLIIHKIGCAYVFFVELVVPLGFFFGQEIRLYTFILLATLQLFIYLTGNFSYLNHLTFVFSTLLISDKYLLNFFSAQPTFTVSHIEGLSTSIALLLSVLQLTNLWNYFFKNKPLLKNLLNTLSPFHLILNHGIFAIMTTKRYEIIIEASLDGIDWKEYDFYFKPSNICRRPKRNSPYQPRLDWMMWFLPFRSYEYQYWFQQFLHKLLIGSEDVLKLIRSNPFNEKNPKYIRALIYDYQFSENKMKKTTNAWWQRKLLAQYSPTLVLMKKKETL